MPRGGYTPGRRPSAGRPAKGGDSGTVRITVRLSAEAQGALSQLCAEGRTVTQAIEHALVVAVKGGSR